MTRSLGKNTLAGLLSMVIGSLTLASDAQAGWFFGRHSSGGSSGSWGSSGSSGSWGSSGGWRIRHHWFWRHGSSGSSGSHGSWGSSGGYVYYHSSGGSSGSWGSSGGSSGGTVRAYRPMPEGEPKTESQKPMTEPMPADKPAEPEKDGAKAEGTSAFYDESGESSLLTVRVPADARVFVNGKLTRTPGEERQFVSRNLVPGYRYSYRIRAEIEREGRTLTDTKVVDVVAGEATRIGFDFESAVADEKPAEAAPTKLTIRLPADAKLFLAGKPMRSTGEVRTFTTARMTEGQEWTDYTVRAVAVRDGRTVTQEKTITLRSGRAHELSFTFDAPAVAAAAADSAR